MRVIEGDFNIVGFKTGGGKAAKVILEKNGEKYSFYLSRIPQSLIIGKDVINLRIIKGHTSWHIWWPNDMIWHNGQYRKKEIVEDVFKVSGHINSKGNARLVLTSETTLKKYEVFLYDIFPVLDRVYWGHKIKIKEDRTGGSYVWRLVRK